MFIKNLIYLYANKFKFVLNIHISISLFNMQFIYLPMNYLNYLFNYLTKLTQ